MPRWDGRGLTGMKSMPLASSGPRVEVEGGPSGRSGAGAESSASRGIGALVAAVPDFGDRAGGFMWSEGDRLEMSKVVAECVGEVDVFLWVWDE